MVSRRNQVFILDRPRDGSDNTCFGQKYSSPHVQPFGQMVYDGDQRAKREVISCMPREHSCLTVFLTKLPSNVDVVIQTDSLYSCLGSVVRHWPYYEATTPRESTNYVYSVEGSILRKIWQTIPLSLAKDELEKPRHTSREPRNRNGWSRQTAARSAIDFN
jgi:hypothetical protein